MSARVQIPLPLHSARFRNCRAFSDLHTMAPMWVNDLMFTLYRKRASLLSELWLPDERSSKVPLARSGRCRSDGQIRVFLGDVCSSEIGNRNSGRRDLICIIALRPEHPGRNGNCQDGIVSSIMPDERSLQYRFPGVTKTVKQIRRYATPGTVDQWIKTHGVRIQRLTNMTFSLKK